jgi:class 3 adenylate cyclase
MDMELVDAVLVMVDISGYTRFIQHQNLSLLHAEDIITQLLETVIDAAEYPLTLNKLEGDAAFLFAKIEGDPEAVLRDVLQQVVVFFPTFRTKTTQISQESAYCQCDACTHIDDLRLKAFMHSGPVVIKKIRQFEELAGDSVILVHRLLKNSVPGDEYLLMTQAVFDALGPLPGFQHERRSEQYPDIGKTVIEVFYPLGDTPAPLETLSGLRLFPHMIARMLRLLAHLSGLARRKTYHHLSNERVGLLALLKEFAQPRPRV